MLTTDKKAFFAAVQPPLEGPGKVHFSQCSDDPLTLLLELLQGHGPAHHSLFCVGKRK
jgi:hypothetical protein